MHVITVKWKDGTTPAQIDAALKGAAELPAKYPGVLHTWTKTLKAQGINDSWATLRKTMEVQRRVTTSMQRSDGRSIHIRKSTKAEPALMRIYQALGISAAPGGTKKLVA